MNFRYENNKVYLTDDKGTNIEQPFWEDTYVPFKDYYDAKEWVVNYLSKNLNTSIIYFDISLENNNILVDNNVLAINKLYKIVLKESTDQLLGNYDIQVTLKGKDDENHEIIKPISFVDGEGTFEIMFNEPGTMEIHLENDFKIGEQHYVFINDTTQKEVELLQAADANHLVYVIE